MRLRVAVLVGVLLGHSIGLLLAPKGAWAISGSVLISEVQTAGASRASDEFVELYNATDGTAIVDGWILQYRPASAGSDCAKGWTTKATVASGQLQSHGFYLFAPSSYLSADTSFSSGLTSAGALRILDAGKATVDALAWGGAACGRGTAAPASSAGGSLERRPGSDLPDGGNAIDTGDNAADFIMRSEVQPQSTTAPTEIPIDYPNQNATPAPVYPSLKLSELMIDPVSPASDSHDEFVEIYNPNPEPVQLQGYTVKTGDHEYHLLEAILPPNGYTIVTSGATTISLTNSGGVASLQDPAGVTIDTAAAWGPAIPGASWAFFADGWQWTLKTTPSAANILEAPATADGNTTPPPGLGGSYPAVELSELLPDPATPATDANDEFIELYNPNSDPVNLSGYVIKTGDSLSNSYTLENQTLAGGAYLVLTSAQTQLTLANDGSSVALYDPAGHQLGATVTYPAAKPGETWARFDNGWAWTTTPTLAAVNQLTVPPVAAGKVAAAKTTKPAAAKSPAKPKAAAKPKASPKPRATTKKAAAKSNRPLVAATTSTGGRWLLFGLAGLTIAYIIYEFRYDLRNFYFKLRGYPGGGGSAGSSAPGRGSDRTGERSGRGQDNLRPRVSPRPRLQW